MKDKYVEMLRKLVLEFAKCEIDYKIDFSDNVKRLLLFDKFDDHYIINEDMMVAFHKLDISVSGLSFKNVDVAGMSLGYLNGVKINPQEVYNKDLSDTSLNGVFIEGSFDDVFIKGVSFIGALGNINVNPETIVDKNLSYAILDNVNFIGSFDDAMIFGADFEGSKNAIIDPQTIFQGDLSSCNFRDVYFDGTFEDCNIELSEFAGSENAVIVPQLLDNASIKYCVLEDAT
ncbi:MAG: hypothetical protein Q4C38_04820, partial [bacterium]|nr:hypothetical protein [bacterium]